MPDDSTFRRAAQKALDEGGPTIVIGRSDRYSGSQMSAPVVHGLAYFAEGHDDSKGKALEEKLVKDAFAAFRETYIAALKKLVGGDEEAEPTEQKPPAKPIAKTGAVA